MKEEKVSVSHSEKGCPGNTDRAGAPDHPAETHSSIYTFYHNDAHFWGRQSIMFIHTFKVMLPKDLPAPTGHNL